MATGWNCQPARAAANAFVPDRGLFVALVLGLRAGSRCAARDPESFRRNVLLRLSSVESRVFPIGTWARTNFDPARGQSAGARHGLPGSADQRGPGGDRAR